MSEKDKTNRAYIWPLLLSLCSGSGTSGEANDTGHSIITDLSWLGSAIVGAFGFVGIIYLFLKLKHIRYWLIMLFGLSLDYLINYVLLQFVDYSINQPLALWPYIIGTCSTFLMAVVLGYLVPESPLKVGMGVVSIDLFLTGLSGFNFPMMLSRLVFSRIIAAYCAAGFGALIGMNLYFAVKRDKTYIGRLITNLFLGIAAAGVGGVITWFIIEKMS